MGYPKDSLLNNATDTVHGVFMGDVREADEVVGNYLDFYDVYYKYMVDTLNSEDSVKISTVANMCPGVDGMCVYGARALYSAIFGTCIIADDECSVGEARHANAHDEIKGDQAYSIHPNPNNGNLNIVQRKSNNLAVTIQIWDVMGKQYYNAQTNFVGNMAAIHLNSTAPGLYILKIMDTNGGIFDYKFIVQ